MKQEQHEKIINQLYRLERCMRSLRAEMESFMEEPDTSRKPGGLTRIETPLTTLLHSATALPRRHQKPYESFFPGIHFAHPPTGNAVELTAETRGFKFPAENGQNQEEGASCLIIRVTRKSPREAAWVTLETELEPQALLTLNRLDIRIMMSFRNHSPVPLGNLRVFLRLFDEKGGFEDIGHKSFPALELPIEFTHTLDAEKLAQIPRQNLHKARLIIGLPMSDDADYAAILSFFELTV
ncbi:hypothetical protein [Ectothiorhodospira lacustris]|uniref:hypothetical protein n=1 Tax=Ectothiorhodospira lacustris TaxID=2899127 RepID=UPI001EE9242A|nr:hypothetical protein [Ectothiorhodospira lacustris]MCG5500823.1 hypothetical protein [Ectothiorhodospira lacustris]